MSFPLKRSAMIVGLSLSALGARESLESLASPASTLRELAQKAVGPDNAESSAAIQALRETGPEGLQAVFDAHADLIRQARTSARPTERSETWQRLTAALDAIGQQRDCYASGLYWYTDFEKAKAAARAQGKPILSLRLLGRLDEEFSCANSRFFRTVLYANAEVSKTLRERFVLHWKSVRPVPRVTVDFGDGRKLERTITGNSIHYILDTEGRPVDALPGLYAPKAFLRGIEQAEAAGGKIATLSGTERELFLRQYHSERLEQIAFDAAIQRHDSLEQGSPIL